MDDQTDPLGGAGDQNPLGDTEEGGGGEDNDPYVRASVIERTSSYEQTLYRDNENSNDKEQPVAYNNERETDSYRNDREPEAYHNKKQSGAEPYQHDRQLDKNTKVNDYREDQYKGGNVDNEKAQNEEPNEKVDFIFPPLVVTGLARPFFFI